eukprot:jgi/Chlat1/1092/Chrsp110S01546
MAVALVAQSAHAAVSVSSLSRPRSPAAAAVLSSPSSRRQQTTSASSFLSLSAGAALSRCRQSGQQQRRRLQAAAARAEAQPVAAERNLCRSKVATSNLVLIRHGESLWNKLNLFTGCVDVPLSEKGVQEALNAGQRISDIPVDVIYVSALIRAQMTAMIAMTQHSRKKVPVMYHAESERAKDWSRVWSDTTSDNTIPVIAAWQLNERMYGELQGLNKAETAKKFGDEQVKLWRRSFDIPPPNGESLEMCAERAVAYFKENVEPQMAAGRNVLIAAHGNSLRAIIMYLDSLTQEEVITLELSTGIPLLYEYHDGQFYNRGAPLSRDEVGVYALSQGLASYRDQLDIFKTGYSS